VNKVFPDSSYCKCRAFGWQVKSLVPHEISREFRQNIQMVNRTCVQCRSEKSAYPPISPAERGLINAQGTAGSTLGSPHNEPVPAPVLCQDFLQHRRSFHMADVIPVRARPLPIGIWSVFGGMKIVRRPSLDTGHGVCVSEFFDIPCKSFLGREIMHVEKIPAHPVPQF